MMAALVKRITSLERAAGKPGWSPLIAWTPVVTQGVNVTITTNNSYYRENDDFVEGAVSLTCNSTGTAAQPVKITLPLPGRIAYSNIGVGSIVSTGATRYPAAMEMPNTTEMWFADSTQAAGAWALGTVTLTAAVTAGASLSASFRYRRPA